MDDMNNLNVNGFSLGKNKIRKIQIIGGVLVFLLIIIIPHTFSLFHEDNSEILERYINYNGVYLPKDTEIKFNSNGDIIYIGDSASLLNYNYTYDHDLVKEVRYEGLWSGLDFFGKMNFSYDGGIIKRIDISNSLNHYDYNTSFDYEFKDGKLVRVNQIDKSNDSEYPSNGRCLCELYYYKNYVLEECSKSNHGVYVSTYYYKQSIYLYDELDENMRNIWNRYQIMPSILYATGYFSAVDGDISIDTRNVIGVPYYLGKQLYSYRSEVQKKTANGEFVSDNESIIKKYFDNKGRILMLELPKVNMKAMYMYLGDTVRFIDNGIDDYEGEITFDDKGYTMNKSKISSSVSHEKTNEFSKYFEDNVYKDEVDEILNNWDKIKNGIYNVKYYEEPKATFYQSLSNDYVFEDVVQYGSLDFRQVIVKLDNVNNWSAKINNHISKCEEITRDSDVFIKCKIDSNLLKLGRNTFEVFVSNEKYKDVPYRLFIDYEVDEMEVFVGEIDYTEFSLDAPSETLDYEFINYGSDIKAPKLRVLVKAPYDSVTYTLKMEDTVISDKISTNEGKYIDLTPFCHIKFDKTGKHKAILTIKDKYDRIVTRELTFNYI